MFGFSRWTVMLVMMAVAGVLAGITAGIAQNPPTEAEMAAAAKAAAESETELEPDSALAEQIRLALKGRKTSARTGDLVLDDMLGVAGERGSILEGSSLDDDSTADQAGASDRDATRRAFAAELLLKTSRQLEKVADRDPSRQELVNKMRIEAVKLLSE